VYKINIIIPSIRIDSRLIRCLDGIQKLNYKNFFVTLILESKKNIYKLKKFKFIIKTLVTKKMNMSEKRNFAVKKFNSGFVAFIDSDACPNKNWLSNALKTLKSRKIGIIGGPNIPFKDETFWQKISYYCKRSFFVTANYNFINYMSKNKYCEFLHSSNFIIDKKIFMSVNGYNKNLYINEDHDLFFRLKEKIKNLKVYFEKKVFVYHEDREFIFFLLQRLCYGLNVFSAKNTNSKIILASMPAFFICIIFSLLLNFSKVSLVILSLSFIIISCIIYVEINRYIKKFEVKLLMIFCIYLSNLFYGLGTFIYFCGLRGMIEKKIYRNIRKKN